MDFACNAFVCSRFLERDEKRYIRESTSQNGSLSQREREKELSFPLLKISKLKRRKELEIVVYVAREDTHTQRERETEVSFRLVSAREDTIYNDYLVEQFRPVRCETKRVDQFARELAPSIGRDVVLHVREVHVPVERGESTVSRCASGVSLVVAMRFVVAPELVVFLHLSTNVCETRVKNVKITRTRMWFFM